jgi:hypothetical protein
VHLVGYRLRGSHSSLMETSLVPTQRPGRLLAGPVLAVALIGAVAGLSGCGGSDSAAASSAASSSASDSPTAAPTSPQPTATAPGDVSTTTTTTAAPVPSGGPTEAGRFPVPKGVKVKGPAPQADSWQFDITTKDTAGVLAFYRTALAAQGYKVENDINKLVGAEKVHYDIYFTGPAQGYIVADPSADDVFVLVESLPTSE